MTSPNTVPPAGFNVRLPDDPVQPVTPARGAHVAPDQFVLVVGGIKLAGGRERQRLRQLNQAVDHVGLPGFGQRVHRTVAAAADALRRRQRAVDYGMSADAQAAVDPTRPRRCVTGTPPE